MRIWPCSCMSSSTAVTSIASSRSCTRSRSSRASARWRVTTGPGSGEQGPSRVGRLDLSHRPLGPCRAAVGVGVSHGSPLSPFVHYPGTTRASADTAGARYVPPSDARIVQQYRLGMRNGELTTAFRAKRKRSQPECFSTVVAVNRRGGTEESPADGLPPAIRWAAGLFGSGGGGGIRTHEPPYDGQRFSRPARRSSSPSGCRQSGCLGRMRNKRDLALRDHVDRQE